MLHSNILQMFLINITYFLLEQSSDGVPAVSTTGDDEIHVAEENTGGSEAMVVEDEKTAEDALPGGNDKISD